MTKVWIVEKGYRYEGGSVLGVFVGQEKAIEACHADFVDDYHDEEDGRPELNFEPFEDESIAGFRAIHGIRYYHVEEWEVQS